jgi:hypothetical protein
MLCQNLCCERRHYNGEQDVIANVKPILDEALVGQHSALQTACQRASESGPRMRSAAVDSTDINQLEEIK